MGVDLVDVEAFRARLEGRDDLLRATFSDGELAYCRAQRNPWPHLAARFAAREALLKAMETGLAGGMAWRDVEVARTPAGAPRLVIGGATGERCERLGVRQATVSLAHTDAWAVAVVLLQT